jgi:hypothetical protein
MAAYTTDVPATGEERVMPSTPAEPERPGPGGTVAPEGADPPAAAEERSSPVAVDEADDDDDVDEVDARTTPAVTSEDVPLAELLATEPAGEVVQVAHLDWRSGAWIAGGLFTSLLLIGLLRNTPASLTRIGVGVLLAFALDPVVVRARHRLGISRVAAVGLVSLGVAAVFAILGCPTPSRTSTRSRSSAAGSRTATRPTRCATGPRTSRRRSTPTRSPRSPAASSTACSRR